MALTRPRWFAALTILLAAGFAAISYAMGAATIGLEAGRIGDTSLRVAVDLASVLDDTQIRILPIVGTNSLQCVEDLFSIKGVDLCIVQSDVLSYAKKQRLRPDLEHSIQYIAKLYNAEIHVLARGGLAKLEELTDKEVNIGIPGSGTAITALALFERLGIKPKLIGDTEDVAFEKLKQGKIAALVYVTGKPAPLFSSLGTTSGLHFLPVPITTSLLQSYLPAQLNHADYPDLIPNDAPIDTVTIGTVMAVAAMPPGSERFVKMMRFVDDFFARFKSFHEAPRDQKWKEVNLAAQLPGWTRFPPAQDWLDGHVAVATSVSAERAQFEAFLARSGIPGTQLSAADREILFRQYLDWRKQQRAGQ